MTLSLNTALAVLGLAMLSGATTLLGVAFALRLQRHPRWIAAGIGFSAGMMLFVSLFELIPEARSLAGLPVAALSAGAGAAGFTLLHWLLPHTHLFEESGALNAGLLRGAYLVVLGLVLHDLPEGFAMANSYLTAPSLGIFVAVAVALHNIPEEFAMAVPAIALKQRRFLYQAAVVSALAEPAGNPGADGSDDRLGLAAAGFRPMLVPVFMSMAAGAMVFVAVHELVPMARRYGRMSLFTAGMTISGVVYAGLAWLILGSGAAG